MRVSVSFAKFRLLCLALAPLLLWHLFASSAPAKQAQQQGQEQSQQSQSVQSQPPLPADPPSSAAPQPKDSGDLIGPLPIKRRKIWTNDDVVSLRNPADRYLEEKEAQQAAAVEAAAKRADLAKEVKDAGLTLDLPSNADATQRLIRDREEHLKDFQQRVDLLRHLVPDAPAEKKDVMQKQLEDFTREVRKSELELKYLHQHLDEQNKANPREPSAPSSNPPSEPNLQ
jgi:hypothetical protein